MARAHVVPAIPYAQTLAISPDGATLYGCISSGRTGEVAAYSAAAGKLIRVLHRWTLSPAAGSHFCQVSADATGKVLLAAYFSDSTPRASLIGVNPQAGTPVTLPVQADHVIDGNGPPGSCSGSRAVSVAGRRAGTDPRCLEGVFLRLSCAGTRLHRRLS